MCRRLTRSGRGLSRRSQGRTQKRDGRRRDHREVIDAIAHKFGTGTQWVQLPKTYGNCRGVSDRLRIWAVDGTWERVFATPVAQARHGRGPEPSRWTPPSCGLTSTRPGPAKRGPGPRCVVRRGW
ncbi:transposase [Streptomyces sp. NPDC057245]|uniref:transposase n=1 Tax=Streptomyces sp. NPDC057245 TaxID=3346065 RepID=UPI003641C00F